MTTTEQQLLGALKDMEAAVAGMNSQPKPNLMARNTLKYKTIDPQLRAKMRDGWNRPVMWPLVVLVVVLVVSAIPAYRTYTARQKAAVQ